MKKNTVPANTLINFLIEKLNLKNDSALSTALEVAPPVISKIRCGKIDIGATFLLRAHEATGVIIAELRAMGNVAPLLKVAA